ncbi:hypothetical protein B0H13DRAFT_2389964 [Mycena leptocephala]|nr:hypothetical protein B0H13DRAFT_2389964 [Mycena leptocephala]
MSAFSLVSVCAMAAATQSLLDSQQPLSLPHERRALIAGLDDAISNILKEDVWGCRSRGGAQNMPPFAALEPGKRGTDRGSERAFTSARDTSNWDEWGARVLNEEDGSDTIAERHRSRIMWDAAQAANREKRRERHDENVSVGRLENGTIRHRQILLVPGARAFPALHLSLSTTSSLMIGLARSERAVVGTRRPLRSPQGTVSPPHRQMLYIEDRGHDRHDGCRFLSGSSNSASAPYYCACRSLRCATVPIGLSEIGCMYWAVEGTKRLRRTKAP